MKSKGRSAMRTGMAGSTNGGLMVIAAAAATPKHTAIRRLVQASSFPAVALNRSNLSLLTSCSQPKPRPVIFRGQTVRLDPIQQFQAAEYSGQNAQHDERDNPGRMPQRSLR